MARMEVFKKKVWTYYRKHGRILPWRKTHDPYKILVSEIMLQQTQVSRVLVKYPQFLKKFPTLQSLARAKISEVLKVWQGMGYNRRAVALHKIAKLGSIPSDPTELEKLPSVGPYTAAAIAVFAFNEPLVMIETNIRRVFIHEFFHDVALIDDRRIKRHVKKTLDLKNPREWYYALMDYGASLPKEINRRSRHYNKQSKFEGSNRQIRGALVRELLKKPTLTAGQLATILRHRKSQIASNLQQLKREGLV